MIPIGDEIVENRNLRRKIGEFGLFTVCMMQLQVQPLYLALYDKIQKTEETDSKLRKLNLEISHLRHLPSTGNIQPRGSENLQLV